MNQDTQGWLAISTEGFASMNAARPPEHLIKELVQNSLDSFAEGQPGSIRLSYGYRENQVWVECLDNGSGIDNLADLRVVYLTHKTDSHLKRGRFGRGFKEALCIAEQAQVISGSRQLEFLRENGQRITRQGVAFEPWVGTCVRMRMPWPAETIDHLDRYFAQFLVPEGVELRINGRAIAARPVEARIEASLTTEIYDYASQSWKKPNRKTRVHLVRTGPDETPSIYEMGIPVAAVEWGVPYHCDIQQRVPMNPNRDAVSSGYPLKLHVACLPTLIEEMDAETIKQDWVGNAGRRCEEAVQRRIVERAFGQNIARSVPKMGARQYDENARDLGVEIVNTAQTSGGFREMLKALVPSSMEVVRQDEQTRAEQAAAAAFDPSTLMEPTDRRLEWVRQRGGHQYVQTCMEFAVWFCQQLVNTCEISQPPVSGQLTVSPDEDGSFYASWDSDNVLTLALDQPSLWQDPFGPDSLQTLIHEAAHAMNMHHGYDFRREVERMAGVAASLMLHQGPQIRSRFPTLLAA